MVATSLLVSHTLQLHGDPQLLQEGAEVRAAQLDDGGIEGVVHEGGAHRLRGRAERERKRVAPSKPYYRMVGRSLPTLFGLDFPLRTWIILSAHRFLS